MWNIVAGLLGAAGVALGAVATHRVQDPALATAATYLVVHAAALLALSPRVATGLAWWIAATLLAAGTALFAGDIASRAFFGGRLFPLAAPTGGTLMILGWLSVAAAGVVDRLSRR